MREIKVFAHISLDGVIAPESSDSDYSDGGWTAPYRTPGGAAALVEAQGTTFDLLLGRRTYDLWSGHWPKAPGGPISDPLNAATKFVATHRPEGLEWGPARDLGADVVAEIRRLKAGDGPDLMVWGSTSLTALLFEQGLVDDVVLFVYPLLLGRGKRFFPGDGSPRGLAFHSTQAMPSGVLLNRYRWVGPVPSA